MACNSVTAHPISTRIRTRPAKNTLVSGTTSLGTHDLEPSQDHAPTQNILRQRLTRQQRRQLILLRQRSTLPAAMFAIPSVLVCDTPGLSTAIAKERRPLYLTASADFSPSVVYTIPWPAEIENALHTAGQLRPVYRTSRRHGDITRSCFAPAPVVREPTHHRRRWGAFTAQWDV